MEKIIELDEGEWRLLQTAEKLEKESNLAAEKAATQKSSELGHHVLAPMVFYSDNEIGILNARDAMIRKYQQNNNLTEKPVFIPGNFQQVICRETNSNFHPNYNFYRRERYDSPLPEDLAQEFLKVVFTFRNGERLYLWTGNHYQYCSDSEVKARIKTVISERIRVPNPSALLSNILGLLKAEERIAGEPDTSPHLIALQNGFLDLNSLQLHPPHPGVFLTHFLDVPWEGAQPCPFFMEFLQHTAGGDPELIQRLLEIIGYLLVPDYRAKRFVVFQGEGDCGKSVLGNLISSFFPEGDYASLADYQFGERFAMATIANCHLCLSMDLSDGVIDSRAVSVLKQLTGDDPISIEAKGKDAYTGRIRCKILFATNNPIKLKSRHQPFARRLLLMPFLYPVPDWKKDRSLLAKLKQERPGILYLALRAYHNVVVHNYQFTGEERFGFTTEQIVLDQEPANGIDSFADRCCAIIPDCFTPTEQLHEAYLKFCQENNLHAILDRAAFSRALKLHLGSKICSAKQRVNGTPLNGYRGIQLQEGERIHV